MMLKDGCIAFQCRL